MKLIFVNKFLKNFKNDYLNKQNKKVKYDVCYVKKGFELLLY